jgi:hypothetical protein
MGWLFTEEGTKVCPQESEASHRSHTGNSAKVCFQVSPFTFHILDVFFFSAADICSAPLPNSSFSKSCNQLGV